MFDINFYMKSKEYMKSEGLNADDETIFKKFEEFRNKQPIIYNIETTNACNMKCKMCPRTTSMTRPVETMSIKNFDSIVEQINPFTLEEWNTWKKYVKDTYGIDESEQSENNFFLYIIPKVIQLHGYGDPLLDKNIIPFVKKLSDKNIETYFSCNPCNLNMSLMERILDSGLSYIKFSIESTDDNNFTEVRNNKVKFDDIFNNISKMCQIKKQNNHKIVIVITMIDLNRTKQEEEFIDLQKRFKDLDVYVYLKSEDQQWYRKDYHQTKSIHWMEFCKHPWMSMTIKSNGEVAMCMEDFNNEIVLGDSNVMPLYDIWNSNKYNDFRKSHFDLNIDNKCLCRCDMKLIGSILRGSK